MTENFRFAGLIALALPNARIIHVRRDPVDTCFSCFSTLFVENMPYTYDLAELGRYYRAYEALMDLWRDVLPQGMMIDVRYEDVVADIEGQGRRILDHCGLEWDARCLDFHRNERSRAHGERRSGAPPALQQFGRTVARYEAFPRASACIARRFARLRRSAPIANWRIAAVGFGRVARFADMRSERAAIVFRFRGTAGASVRRALGRDAADMTADCRCSDVPGPR